MPAFELRWVAPENSAHTLFRNSVKTECGGRFASPMMESAATLAPVYTRAQNPMNVDRPTSGLSADSNHSRTEWSREVFSVAEALRRNGRHRRLRDVTIVLPIDHTAVEAIELACLALSEGELSEAARDLDRFFDRLSQDSFESERFLASVRNVARRVGQIAK